MFQLITSASFDSAHFLSGYSGKCSRLHGHHWVLEVVIQSEALQAEGEKRGMILDFSDFKKAVRALADLYDHALIVEKETLQPKTMEAMLQEGFLVIEIPCRPTAENLAKRFYHQLKEQGLPVCQVTVYETPENGAVYKEDQPCSR